MKYCIYYALMCAGFIIGTARVADAAEKVWGPLTNGLRASLTVDELGRKVTNGSPIKVVLHLNNFSNAYTVHFYEPSFVESSSAFQFRVVAPSGSIVPAKKLDHLHGSGQFVDIKPGETTTVILDLTKSFSFSQPGSYSVRGDFFLGRWLDAEGKNSEATKVKSNELRIQIAAD